ncbi:molecular chaperone [Pseudescherichia sp.]|uniref:fimbrial biogenesis chaperone n=1 Tax=Pseudescherichia sp. TaxID=2055881 RepID=UPI00289E7363|nr:molecular chaperone [Pseudescherichia sp.]
MEALIYYFHRNREHQSMRKPAVFFLLAVCLSITISSASAGVIIGGTRLIYHGNDKEASIQVKSDVNDKSPYLIQSFIDDNGPKGDRPGGTDKLPFTVTPPLFRLDAGTENTVRLVKTGSALPSDRESVYWLNIKAIPANNPQDKGKNVLRFSLKNRIKLFYRPAGLGDPSHENLQTVLFQQRGKTLTVTNPTPWYLTFYALSVGGRPVDTKFTMVAPHSSHQYLLPQGASGHVAWQYINDYGSPSAELQGGG